MAFAIEEVNGKFYVLKGDGGDCEYLLDPDNETERVFDSQEAASEAISKISE